MQLFWTPDVIIHDLVKFNKPEILNQVGALEIFKSGQVYYKVRYRRSKTLSKSGNVDFGVDGNFREWLEVDHLQVSSSLTFDIFPIFYTTCTFPTQPTAEISAKNILPRNDKKDQMLEEKAKTPFET